LAYIVLERDFDERVKGLAFFAILPVTPEKAADCAETANYFQSAAEESGRSYGHCGGAYVGADVMGGITSGFDGLKKVLRQPQTGAPGSFDRQTDGIGTRVKLAVFAGNVVFEYEHVISVVHFVH
jgi:hypothetical protein